MDGQHPESTKHALPEPFRLGSWRVLRSQNRLEPLPPGGTSLKLEPKAMDVFCLLAEHAGHTVSREVLLEQVWHGRIVEENALSRVIRALRVALGDDARAPRYIETVTKRGYRLLVQPEPDVDAATPAAEVAPVSAEAPLPADSTADVGTVHPNIIDRSPAQRLRVLGVGAVLCTLAYFGTQMILASSALDSSAQRVLWVDDRPEGNREEIRRMEHLGVRVDTAISNADAAEHLRGRQYALVISDMKRPHPETQLAGLDLPREVILDRNRLPPVVYYVGQVTTDRTPDGYPVTNDPERLLRLVSELIPPPSKARVGWY